MRAVLLKGAARRDEVKPAAAGKDIWCEKPMSRTIPGSFSGAT